MSIELGHKCVVCLAGMVPDMSAYMTTGELPGWCACETLPPVRGKQHNSEGGYLSSGVFPTDALGTSTITFTGLPTGTDIIVLQAGTTDVILQVDQHPSSSYALVAAYFATPTFIDIGFIKPGYIVFYIRALQIPEKSTIIPVALRLDINYT